MRLRIDLAYDGADFHGWAAQPGLRTVEEDLTTALRTVLRMPRPDPGADAGDRVALRCAGRTDAGVHARAQVCHVDLPPARIEHGAADGLDRLLRRLNGILAPDVRVRSVRIAADGFDARFSALWRRYAYRVADRADRVDPLRRGHVLTWPHALDLEAMRAAAQPLLGRHDFAAFCKHRPGATTIRTLLDLGVERTPDGLVTISVRADAFCHSMVRSLVGPLVAVGEGRQPGPWVAERLAGRRRTSDLLVAPARGLTLEEVCYPPEDELAARAEQTRARRQEHEVGAG